MRLLFFAVAAAFFPAAAVHAADGSSLYDRSSARAVAREVSSTFGPGATRIRYDERMIQAARIARKRAHRETTWYCWRYVKDALLASGVISSRPQTAWAKQAGTELTRRFGFRRLTTRDPRRAPVGAVIVYGGSDAGHVEIRTADGYASDFVSHTPYPRPVLGIYVKPA